MKRKREVFALILVSIFLGLILSIQFKTVNKSVGDGILPTQRAHQLATELKNVQAERDTYLNKIIELEEKIDLYEKGEIDKSSYAENLYKETLNYRMLAANTDLEGEGVILEINDPPEEVQIGGGFSIADDIDMILQIISILNSAEAEAISINDQRFTAYTGIVRAADHIEINGVSTNAPITIKAIGNPDTLESALMFKGGVVWDLRRYNYIVHLSQDKNIVIPKHRKVKEFKYAVPIEG